MEYTGKRILFLGAPIFQIPVIQKAKEMGLRTGIVDINEKSSALPYADDKFICSLRDPEAVLKIAREYKPDGIVIGTLDTSVRTAAYVANALNLPGHTMEAALNATDKVRMLEAFEKGGVAHPAYQVVKKADIDTFEMTLPYPVISKPVDSAGGRGVSIIRNDGELRDAVRFSSDTGLSGDILIEEYMRGSEVSVEVLIVDGRPYVLQITDKITSGEPNFFEIGHSQPSVLPADTKDKIKELASKAVLAVGLDNTPAHVEIMVTGQGPKMIEMGARLGADCITTYLINTSVSGINMAQAAIELALGEKPDVSHYHDSGICAGIRFIPAKAGTLKEIRGLDEAEKMSDVVIISITGKIGRHYSDATDNSARFGHVVCSGKTTKEALEQCSRVIDKLQFVVD
ncbi:MAG: ATP-grasp domain-containing protein [Clostridia bacterium]|nr:ATP-grasp domain-containing protein [Clostridia bacterium]